MRYRDDVVMMRRGRANSRYALLPADDRAADAIAKVSADELVGVRIMRDRSLPQHNLFWTILDYVARATKFGTPDRLLVALKIKLGRYDLCQLPSGKAVPIPHSISFAAMGQDEFQRFFDESLGLICSEVLPGYDPERLIAEAGPPEEDPSAARRRIRWQLATSQSPSVNAETPRD